MLQESKLVFHNSFNENLLYSLIIVVIFKEFSFTKKKIHNTYIFVDNLIFGQLIINTLYIKKNGIKIFLYFILVRLKTELKKKKEKVLKQLVFA
jgi:hypothetical protein